MKRFVLFFTAGSIFLFSFFIFTFLVRTRMLNSFDFNSTVIIQDHIPITLDPTLSLLSLAGSFEIMSGILLILISVNRKMKGFLVFPLYFFAHVIELFGKALFNHPGPPYMFFRYAIPFIFPSSYVQPGSSYPSGHSFRIVYIMIIIGYLFFKKITKKINLTYILLILTLTGITGITLISRISLGEHWPTDVIAGALLGAAFGLYSLLLL